MISRIVHVVALKEENIHKADTSGVHDFQY